MPATLKTEVLVIGGGATGAAVAWDCALRGYETVLAERRDLAEGTSGRFHGLLHSGGRYAVKDPDAAVECIEENVILRRIAADCIEDTGGLFVTTPDDDPAYGDRFLEGCAKTGVPTEEIDTAEALRREPRLNPGIKRAFTVPDASIDAWKTVWALAHAARGRGATVLPYHAVVDVLREGDAVVGARLHDERSGEEVTVEARMVLNASGAWAGQIADMAGIEGVEIIPGKGIMIAMNHRLVNTVINRCTMPADGDILVPIRTVSRDRHDRHPRQGPRRAGDHPGRGRADARRRRAARARLPPGPRAARLGRGAPAVPGREGDAARRATSPAPTRCSTTTSATASTGFLTITGGKLTTMRLMAQDIVDAMCAQLGDDRPCTTDKVVLPGSEDLEPYHIGERLKAKEDHLLDDQLVCECELIPRARLEATMRERETTNLDDIRRSLRLGMGPCQGGFCIYRATGILHGVEQLDAVQANGSLRNFLEERWKGVWPILYGDQLRQARLDDWIFQGLLDVEHLPQ